MPTSGPGSSGRRAAARRGVTLLELLVVLAIVALSVAAVSFALRDGTATLLEREGVRLAALLEMARAESRVTGTAVRWVPAGVTVAGDVPGAANVATNADAPSAFRFIGLTELQQLPTHWLEPRVSVEVVGGTTVLLGPDAILPPQRLVLRLDEQRLELATDGLAPFAIVPAAVAAQLGAAWALPATP
ncbi:MAG: prepilin-type N-terminal cleavage/methylation domain-containing protein [Chitinophagaceae bacterium]|nr:prepilin-type N-terminal cleavage/methylation domain-containing protein [Rubrivivax sp.]